jgi:hypothetical protein
VKKLKIGFLFAACVLVFSIQTQGSETQNPGFEDGLKYWTSFIYGSAVPSGHVRIDNSDYESGTASARINFPAGYVANDFGGIQQSVAVDAGQTYLVSVAIKFQNAASCHMKVLVGKGRHRATVRAHLQCVPKKTKIASPMPHLPLTEPLLSSDRAIKPSDYQTIKPKIESLQVSYLECEQA